MLPAMTVSECALNTEVTHYATSGPATYPNLANRRAFPRAATVMLPEAAGMRRFRVPATAD